MVNCQNCGGPIRGDFCQNCGMRTTPIQIQYAHPEEPSTYQQLTSTKKQKPSKREIVIIVVIIAIIVVSIITMTVYTYPSALNKPTNDFKDGFTYEMTSADTMEVLLKYEAAGNDARIERWSIDSLLGDDDGTVDSSEVKEFEDFFNETVVGEESDGITIDNEAGTYSQCDVSYEGVIGDVDSGNPILVTMSFIILWKQIETNNISYSVKISVCAYQSENFRFVPPPGYEITSVIGLDDVNYDNGKTDLTGTIYEGTPNWIPEYIVYITITKSGSQEPTPHSNLSFLEDPVTNGRYSGTFQGIINNSEIEIITLDSSLRIMIVLDLESESTIQIPLYEFNITYSDTNNDSNLDPEDELIIIGGAQGDEVYVVYKPTGGVIATVILD